MNTRTSKHRAAASSAPKGESELPSMEAAARRLAAVSPADLPWLRKEVDLTPPDGGPEVCGPPVYRPSKRQR